MTRIRTELVALANAMAGGNVIHFSASRAAAVEARNRCGLGRGFVHRVGNGRIRFDWIGRVKLRRTPKVTVTFDECVDMP